MTADASDSVRALAEHYDSTDTTAELEQATWEDTVEPDPMVTTSLRLPKSLLDQVRALAASQGVKPTALMRAFVEAGVGAADLRAHSFPAFPDAGTGMTKALALALAPVAFRVRPEHAADPIPGPDLGPTPVPDDPRRLRDQRDAAVARLESVRELLVLAAGVAGRPDHAAEPSA